MPLSLLISMALWFARKHTGRVCCSGMCLNLVQFFLHQYLRISILYFKDYVIFIENYWVKYLGQVSIFWFVINWPLVQLMDMFSLHLQLNFLHCRLNFTQSPSLSPFRSYHSKPSSPLMSHSKPSSPSVSHLAAFR